MQGTIGLAMPVVTRWGSVNRMCYSMAQNEACLKLAVSYPEFPGNSEARVSAAERKRGQEMRQIVDDPMFWDVIKGIRAFTQPASDVSCPASHFAMVSVTLWCSVSSCLLRLQDRAEKSQCIC